MHPDVCRFSRDSCTTTPSPGLRWVRWTAWLSPGVGVADRVHAARDGLFWSHRLGGRLGQPRVAEQQHMIGPYMAVSEASASHMLFI